MRRGRPEGPCRARRCEIAGDNVPADPALGEVVERREPARESIGVFKRSGSRLIPKPRWLVTSAIAETISVGSALGSCTAW